MNARIWSALVTSAARYSVVIETITNEVLITLISNCEERQQGGALQDGVTRLIFCDQLLYRSSGNFVRMFRSVVLPMKMNAFEKHYNCPKEPSPPPKRVSCGSSQTGEVSILYLCNYFRYWNFGSLLFYSWPCIKKIYL